jgi:hypothetical protein
VLGGRGYVTANTVSNAGLLTAGGGTFNFGALTLTSTGTVSGSGTFTNAITGAGSISASGGLLTLTAGVSGTSALSIVSGSTLELGATSTSGAISDKGVLKLDGNSYTATSATVSAGAKLIGTGTVNGTISNSGTVEATTGLLKLAKGASGTGTLAVDSGGTLELAATTTAHTVTDNGVLQLDGKTYTFTALSVTSTGTLAGSGTIAKAFSNSGLVEAKTGTTTLTLGATGTGTLQSDTGATLSLGASADTAGTVTDNGKIQLAGGSLTATTLTVGAAGVISGHGTVAGPITSGGTITASGGLLDVTGGVTGAGHFTIASGATLELGGTTAQSVTYTGTSTLQLDAPANYTGAIGGLALGDAIEFSSETVSSAVINGSTLTVTGSDGVTTYQVSGALTGNHFAVQPDNHTIVLTAGLLLAAVKPSFLAPTASPLDAVASPTTSTLPNLGELTVNAAPGANTTNPAAMVDGSDPTPHWGTLGWFADTQQTDHGTGFTPGPLTGLHASTGF